MEPETPVALDYHRPRRPDVRFRIALLLTVAVGIALGAPMHFWRVSVFVIAPYAFAFTLVMGMVARGREMVIALVAAFTISTVAAGVELYAGRNQGIEFVWNVLAGWAAFFFVASIFAALAVPFARMRIALRR
jgi:hypothetical protein